MNDKMEIIKPGTKARTVIGGIEGMITCVKITCDGICYEFSYFDANLEYKMIQIYGEEFIVADHERQEIKWRN